MTIIEKYKLDYLSKRHQFILFDNSYLILDSCNGIYDLTPDFRKVTITEAFPFLMAFEQEIEELVIGEAVSYDCVGMKYGGISGIFDLWIKKYKESEFTLVLEERTEKNKFWRNIQQERNDVAIRKEIVQAQAKTIEQKNKRISDSINYAKRIQRAVLPNASAFQKLLPSSTVVYQPKDVISGDFYWCGEVNDKVIFAVADSTGHGVPGALLSMLGASLLNQAVLVKGNSSPAQILNVVREGFRKVLFQVKENKIVSDGMEIGVCALSKDNVLKFSGTQTPLAIVTNKENSKLSVFNSKTGEAILKPIVNSDNKNLFLIKGDRQTIGGDNSSDISFTNISVKLEKGDVIYAYTDGIQDQFGGTGDKKFSRKGLWKTLLEVQSNQIHDQGEAIETVLREWQGKQDQTDDICLLGIEL